MGAASAFAVVRVVALLEGAWHLLESRPCRSCLRESAVGGDSTEVACKSFPLLRASPRASRAPSRSAGFRRPLLLGSRRKAAARETRDAPGTSLSGPSELWDAIPDSGAPGRRSFDLLTCSDKLHRPQADLRCELEAHNQPPPDRLPPLGACSSSDAAQPSARRLAFP